MTGSCPYFVFNLGLLDILDDCIETAGSEGHVMFANWGTPLIMLISLACELAAESPSAFDGSLPIAINVGAFAIETDCPLLSWGSAQRQRLIIIMRGDKTMTPKHDDNPPCQPDPFLSKQLANRRNQGFELAGECFHVLVLLIGDHDAVLHERKSSGSLSLRHCDG